ncbi:MAG: type II toxin-antitoxin system VapC family toxin [Verrucomicrobiae bacterium]|nr:type II toxin-antitoxin system VapC family toxin [Verrucomicrobiae bacterium]
MQTVYIETTVVSFLVARTQAGTLAYQWHVWTRDWWRLRRPYFESVTSPEVLREAASGDAEMSRLRLEALSSLTLLRRTPAVDTLAAVFIASGALPQKAKADAVHLAFAAVYKVNYLLTWNFKHLANAVIQARLQPVAEQEGYRLPIVCTPLQLMGTIEYESRLDTPGD